MLERVAGAVKKRHGFDSFWYGNYKDEGDPPSGWHTYPALPRFGSHYRGLLGRLDVLLETYSYIDFPRRCAVMRAWLLELFRDAAKNAERLSRHHPGRAGAHHRARRVARCAGSCVGINYGVATRDDKGALVFEYPAYAKPDDVAHILAFDEASITARRYPGKRRRELSHAAPPDVRAHAVGEHARGVPRRRRSSPRASRATASASSASTHRGASRSTATAWPGARRRSAPTWPPTCRLPASPRCR